jgi:hypothetical protein
MDSSSTIQLRIPKQDLVNLTFDAANPKKMAAWIEALPKVNVGESSRQLYSAIQEINRFKTDPKTRFLILEEMRHSIHYVCKSLGKHFLNQSIVLNEKESKIANLAQALQNHLAIGYKIVLLDTIQQKTSEAAKLRAFATHRTITELTGNLLRCYQLYYPTPKGLWREIHQLYSLADHYGILDKEIEDSATQSKLTIEHCYFRTMLLSTARPNQLRQQEIAQLSQAFNIWAQYCRLKTTDEEPEPFIVDLKSDEGAIYFQWNKEKIDTSSSSLRYVHMSSLADVLRTRIQNINNNEGVDLSIKLLASTVLRHLLQSWSASSQRSFARTTTEGTISLAFGLGAVHYYLSKGQDFNKMLLGGNEDLVLQDEDNPFLTSKNNRNYGFNEELSSGGDVWALSAVTSTKTSKQGKSSTASGKVQTLFAAYDCKLIDTSPGGYCLEWSGIAPTQLKTGEIITIREPGQEDWSVAVVRWIKKISSTQIRLGLELLAPHAQAVGAKVIQKDGSSTEYMRAIRLPELKAIGQPSTLITPQLTFKPGYKVLLNIDAQEVRLHLTNEISSTASFSQFEYKLLGEKVDKQAGQSNSSSEDNDDFNSLWSNI